LEAGTVLKSAEKCKRCEFKKNSMLKQQKSFVQEMHAYSPRLQVFLR